jgi:hypothetical protein
MSQHHYPVSLRNAALDLHIGPRKLTAVLVGLGAIKKTEFGYEAMPGWERYVTTDARMYWHAGIGAYRHSAKVKITPAGLDYLSQQIYQKGTP